MRKWIPIGAFIFILFGTVVAFLILRSQKNLQPVPSTSLYTGPIQLPVASEDNQFVTNKDITDFSLYSNDDPIYTASEDGEDAAIEFIRAGSQEGETQFFPSDQRSQVTKTRQAAEDSGLEHYYYQQTINNIPVFGSMIQVHIKDKNKVYAADANVTKKVDILPSVIPEDEAIRIALAKAREEAGDIPFVVSKVSKSIINPKVGSLGQDTNNHPAIAVRIESENLQYLFDTTYYVLLSKGTVMVAIPHIQEAANRSIRNGRDCEVQGNPLSCAVVREEGGPPTGVDDFDNSYTLTGEVYDYLSNAFDRDGYDGRGSKVEIVPRYILPTTAPTQTPNLALEPGQPSNVNCYNAFWLPTFGTMVLCQNMVNMDVISHELSHGITDTTAGLLMRAQSGAVNESFSDIFAHGVDDDWTIGEDGPRELGVLRYMDNPPLKEQSDSLFSPLYVCPDDASAQREENLADENWVDPCNVKNDFCGVHLNSGILNKAYYLMVAGGTFSGCRINPVPKEKVQLVMYRALTIHLRQNSNFLNTYNAINKACDELKGQNKLKTAECQQIRRAMQATKMDQQETGDLYGDKCLGLPEEAAKCMGNNPTAVPPTKVPSPTRVPTATKTPTRAPSRSPSASPAVTTRNSPTRSITPTRTTSPRLSPTPVVSVPRTSRAPRIACTPQHRPDSKGCEQPTLASPEVNEAAGEITFTWCTSVPQHSYHFRLDNTKTSRNPDTVMDNYGMTSVTLPLSEGSYGWWVHSYCTNSTEHNYEDDYLSKAAGKDLRISAPENKQDDSNPEEQAEENKPTSAPRRNSPTMTPRPSPTPSIRVINGGNRQRRLE